MRRDIKLILPHFIMVNDIDETGHNQFEIFRLYWMKKSPLQPIVPPKRAFSQLDLIKSNIWRSGDQLLDYGELRTKVLL